MGLPFRRRLHVSKRGTNSSSNAPAASADEEEDWLAIDPPGTEPSYLRAERDDAWSSAVSWRGVLVATLLLGCLALLTVYFN